MADILIASDASSVIDEVTAAVGSPDTEVRSVLNGLDVLPAVEDRLPDLAVLDQQIGNMGAMAVALSLHLEEGAGRLDHVPVLMLLDRRADVFLAKRADVEGWLIKPLDPLRLRRAVQAILGGGTYFDPTNAPAPSAAAGLR